VSLVDWTSGEIAAGGSITATVPVLADVGHLGVIVVSYGNDTTIADMTGQGWDAVFIDQLSNGADSELVVYLKEIDGTEGASELVDHGGTPNGAWWFGVLDVDLSGGIAAAILASISGADGSTNTHDTDPITFGEAAYVLTLATADTSTTPIFSASSGLRTHTLVEEVGTAAQNSRLLVAEADEAGAVTNAQYRFTFTAPDNSATAAIAFKVSGGAPVDPPVNTIAPAVTGTAETGLFLACNNGGWSGDPVDTYTYQWKRNGGNIGGATASTYQLQVADEGQSILCTVTATNAGGSDSEDSNTVVPTAPSGGGPDTFVRVAGAWVAVKRKVRVAGAWVE